MPLRILVIDDDYNDRLLIRCALKQIGGLQATIVETDDIERALAHDGDEKFDIAFVDYYILRDECGAKIIENLTRRLDLCPCILVTGLLTPEVSHHGMLAGAATCLDKGEITPKLLDKSIKLALHNWKSRHHTSSHPVPKRPTAYSGKNRRQYAGMVSPMAMRERPIILTSLAFDIQDSLIDAVQLARISRPKDLPLAVKLDDQPVYVHGNQHDFTNALARLLVALDQQVKIKMNNKIRSSWVHMTVTVFPASPKNFRGNRRSINAYSAITSQEERLTGALTRFNEAVEGLKGRADFKYALNGRIDITIKLPGSKQSAKAA